MKRATTRFHRDQRLCLSTAITWPLSGAVVSQDRPLRRARDMALPILAAIRNAEHLARQRRRVRRRGRDMDSQAPKKDDHRD